MIHHARAPARVLLMIGNRNRLFNFGRATGWFSLAPDGLVGSSATVRGRGSVVCFGTPLSVTGHWPEFFMGLAGLVC